MNFWLVARVAMRAIGRNKLRSWLTVTGIVIGVAAVTAAVSLGNSASFLVEDQVSNLGTNILVIKPERGAAAQQGPLLTVLDAHAIGRDCPAVQASCPQVRLSASIVYGHHNRRPRMLGVGIEYLTIRSWRMANGLFFTKSDIQSAAKVCVLGQSVVRKLFRSSNPLGQTVRIGNTPFRVVGVLEGKGANFFGQDQDDVVLMPYTTVRKRLHGTNFNHVDEVLASAYTIEGSADAKMQIEALLNERHDIPPNQEARFRIEDMREIIRILKIVMQVMTLTVGAIAVISLLVGGIGIMNIMLVSVTERTREIGVRMAVGARSRDIVRQFLVESIVLSSMGGALGIPLGVGGALAGRALINAFMPNVGLPLSISYVAAGTALFFAAAVGMFFGYYPARRAGQLDPIDALRYE